MHELVQVCHLSSRNSTDKETDQGYQGEEVSTDIIQENFPDTKGSAVLKESTY